MAEPKVRFRRDDGSSYPAWNNVVLGDIATRVTRKNTNGETDRPLTIASIEGLVDQRTYFGKTVASKDMSGYYLLRNGEYAYNKSYSAGYDYGSIKRLDKYDMGALSTLYICFALNDDQNTDFYDCYFNGLSWYSQMPQICAEGARNHGLLNVSPNDFFKIQLSVPTSKEEQQKIADFLSSVDEVISTSEQEIANLKTQKKAVMKSIFSQDVRFKRADGSSYPEWKKTKMGSLTVEHKVRNKQRLPLEIYSVNNEIGFLPQSEQFDEAGYLSDTDTSIYMIVPPHYFAYNPARINVGSIGYQNVGHDVQVSSLYEVFRTTDALEDAFLWHWFHTSIFNNAVQRLQEGGVRQYYYYEKLRETCIELPCLEEQRLIADFLSDFDEAIAAAKKELELWEKLKKGLQQHIFI